MVKQRQLRHITNPDLINTFYLDSTAVDPELQSSDIVCFRCYKAHLLLTKSLCSSSTDEEIRELLESIKEMGVDNERFGGYENYIAEALKNTFIYVGNILLDIHQSAALLVSIYSHFLQMAFYIAQNDCLHTCISKDDIKISFPQRYLASQLISIFDKHIVLVTKVKRFGVLIHRAGCDLTYPLTKALHALDHQKKCCSSSRDVNESKIESVCKEMNKRLHSQIDSILASKEESMYN